MQSSSVLSRRTPSPMGTRSGQQTMTGSGTFDFASSTLAKKHALNQSAAEPTPVRRQFLESETFIHNNGTKRNLGEEGPVGPNPETVLHGVEPTDIRSTIAASPAPGAGSPTKPTSGNPTPTMMLGTSRSVPARARAMAPGANTTGQPPRPPSTSLRPGSATTAVSSAAASSKRGTQTPTGALAASFEEELTEISRMHDRERLMNLTGTAKATKKKPKSQAQRAASPIADQDAPLPSTEGLDEPIEQPERNTATGKPIHVPYTPDLRAKLSAGTTVHSHTMPKPMVLRDYEMLAEACQRAGRARMEGHAYYKIAEHYAKNKDTLAKSVTYFKRYLNISRRLNDLQGESKALNCLGIVYYEMAQHAAATGNAQGAANNYHIALEYHKQHADIADAAGVFIANTNMGLINALQNNMQAALECHKQALQYAVRAGDKAAESLALANLGQAGAKQGDIVTARVCVERHLELATTLNDNDASAEAYEQLGVIASQRGDYQSASENFLLALDIAIRDGNQELAKSLRCQVGYAQGMLRMEQQMHGLLTSMGSPTPDLQ